MSSRNTGSSSLGLYKWNVANWKDAQATNSTGNSALQATTGMKVRSTSLTWPIQSWYSKRGLDTLGMVIGVSKF